jgi:hypothetical protein
MLNDKLYSEMSDSEVRYITVRCIAPARAGLGATIASGGKSGYG